MPVSTAEQNDFNEIEPVVYYHFEQGQVVELFFLPERQAYINLRLLTEWWQKRHNALSDSFPLPHETQIHLEQWCLADSTKNTAAVVKWEISIWKQKKKSIKQTH